MTHRFLAVLAVTATAGASVKHDSHLLDNEVAHEKAAVQRATSKKDAAEPPGYAISITDFLGQALVPPDFDCHTVLRMTSPNVRPCSPTATMNN